MFYHVPLQGTIYEVGNLGPIFKQAQKDGWVKLVYVILVFSSNLIQNGLLEDTLTSYDFRIGSR
jgi:hypothetical protein